MQTTLDSLAHVAVPVPVAAQLAAHPSSRLGSAGCTGMQLVAPALAASRALAGGAGARRRWAGPLIGLAPALGLSVLALSLGLAEAPAIITAVAATGLGVLACVRFIVRRRPQGAGPVPERAGAADWSRLLGGPRNAKEQFEALQSANDSGDLQRLRECLTPAMFELAQERWRARGGAVQHTQVFGLEAQVVDVAGAAGDHVVSVRFTGRVRGQVGDVPQDLDETWHMTKPRKGRGGWVLAGIQQAPQFP